MRRVKRASARKRNGAAFAELFGLQIQSIIVAFIISDNSPGVLDKGPSGPKVLARYVSRYSSIKTEKEH